MKHAVTIDVPSLEAGMAAAVGELIADPTEGTEWTSPKHGFELKLSPCSHERFHRGVIKREKCLRLISQAPKRAPRQAVLHGIALQS